MDRFTATQLIPNSNVHDSCQSVEVTAPSRLHFGLLSFGNSEGRRFGGAGVMVDRPSLRLRIETAERFRAAGPMAGRVVEFVSRWARFHRLPVLPDCQVTVTKAPRQHAGLGVGTQLGMSVAAGLHCHLQWPAASPDELAMSVGRAKRSAIGTYGFALGGLLAERGRALREPVAALDCQLDLPPSWRMVVVCPQGQGLSGTEEVNAFENLPPVPRTRTNELEKVMRERMFPAAARGDFDEFSKSVYQYGYLAGECFAASQGGPYNGEFLTRVVEAIRSLGVEGVGQSSWGPTIFALVEKVEEGDVLARRLMGQFSLSENEVWVSRVNQGGARITVSSS